MQDTLHKSGGMAALQRFNCSPNSGESYESCIRGLNWRNSNELFLLSGALRNSDFTHRSEELSIALLKADRADLSIKSIRAAIDTLSDEGLFRIISAPETMAQLVYFYLDNSALAAYLEAAIQSEEFRDPRRDSTRHQWTALGDVYFSPGTAPRLSRTWGDVVVDCSSPLGRSSGGRPMPIELKSHWRIGNERAAGKVCRALDMITAASPITGIFIRSTIQTIVLRTRRSIGAVMFNSASARPFVGRILLSNPGATWVDEGRLASAIIHEAIHSLLYRLERLRPLVTPLRLGLSESIESPWTGTRLRLITYIHACAVYYGLREFWGQPAASTIFGKECAIHWEQSAWLGFRGNKFLNRLHPHINALAPTVADGLSLMAEY